MKQYPIQFWIHLSLVLFSLQFLFPNSNLLDRLSTHHPLPPPTHTQCTALSGTCVRLWVSFHIDSWPGLAMWLTLGPWDISRHHGLVCRNTHFWDASFQSLDAMGEKPNLATWRGWVENWRPGWGPSQQPALTGHPAFWEMEPPALFELPQVNHVPN